MSELRLTGPLAYLQVRILRCEMFDLGFAKCDITESKAVPNFAGGLSYFYMVAVDS